ncbi:MAG: [FeFe] hydrogenase H-cluster radical SAM maturase HydE [Clostridiales bacterium]|jgi:biotin synthase|nr:[FeFe] hydrogenase H-cluster radical SAM maturase HydE [Clostridiales bacterium]
MDQLIEKLRQNGALERNEWITLLNRRSRIDTDELFALSREVRESVYGKDVYMRGLIEFTNYCKNDCYYCGIRRGNNKAERYRLTEDNILDCCLTGYGLGFRTFVLQGGEDPYFTDGRLERIVRAIKKSLPDCAVTLSVGERSGNSYERLFNAGAERYLLRNETANGAHYKMLHPPVLSLENRMRCLRDLKEIGYQVGCGFMVGSPGQTPECLADDLMFIQAFKPQMVGIGPFIPHRDTAFAPKPQGSLGLTLFLLAIIRLLLPNLLLPATTALGTIHPKGRELGILAGANVVMPNLSPSGVRGKYLLYDGKICTGDEAAECRFCMQRRIERIGYKLAVSRGDCVGFYRKDLI